jgi:hypothetical protein
MGGKILKSQPVIVQKGNTGFQLDFRELSSGEYIVSVTAKDFNRKIILTKK